MAQSAARVGRNVPEARTGRHDQQVQVEFRPGDVDFCANWLTSGGKAVRWRKQQGDDGLVEDRRGEGGGGVGFPGSGGGRRGIGGLGAIGLLVVVFLAFKACAGGGGLGDVLGKVGSPQDNLPSAPSAPSGAGANDLPAGAPATDKQKEFVTFVAVNVQETWQKIFAQSGQRFRGAKTVLFEGSTRTGCGFAQSGTGPFYCPADAQVYLPLSFFSQLSDRFGAPGDFAQAYVIAHEYGHHIQNLTGTADQVTQLQQQNPSYANALSVRLELQADCYAGIWAHSAYEQRILEQGDLEEGLRAAAAVGDDAIQRSTTGRVNAEAFTHGDSKQRVTWFNNGFQSGNPDDCDTFKTDI